MKNQSHSFFPVVLFCAALTLIVLPSRSHAATPDDNEPIAAPVELGEKTILSIQNSLPSLSTQERAQRVSSRILQVAQNPLSSADKIVTREEETSTDVVFEDLVLMSITDSDAKSANMDRRSLAANDVQLIREAIAVYRETYNLKKIFIGALFALLATAVLVLLIKLVNRGNRFVRPRFDAWRKRRVPSLRLQRIELLTAGRLDDLFNGIQRVLYYGVILVLFYFYIPLVLSFFPWTHDLAKNLFGYILSPLESILFSALRYIPNLIFVVVVFTCIHYALKLINVIFTEVERERVSFPGFYPEWAKPTFQIVRALAWTFSLVIVFPYLPGSHSPAFKGISVFIGVLFSLGSSSAIGNIVAGIILTYMRPFKVGDRVQISDTFGDVREKTLLVTRVRTIKNVDITIPNALVLGSHISNFSSQSDKSGVILHTAVTIGYDAPWTQIHELLIAAGRATKNILSDPAPFVLQTQLGDFNVSYELNAYTDKPNLMAGTYSELHQNIQNKFNEAGVEIMSPHYTSVRDGNHSTIPAAHLPKTYQAPVFRFDKSPAPENR